MAFAVAVLRASPLRTSPLRGARRQRPARGAGASASASASGMDGGCAFGRGCGVCTGGGSVFSKAVWHAVAGIPAGTVWTYGAVADAVGSAGAARAVGRALRVNPHNVAGARPRVPCHRVVAKGGLGGFYGQMDAPRKVELLRAEGALLADGRPDPAKVVSRFPPGK